MASEQEDQVFSLSDVVTNTGWAPSTVESYRTKKWYPFLVEVDGGYKCQGLDGKISKEAFIKLHSPKTRLQQDLLCPELHEQVHELIRKSREAALLAIQIYNNPQLAFRTSGFITNMLIAYTALFQAVFERRGVDYWYKEADGSPRIVDGDPKYWDVSKCAGEYYGGNSCSEHENLKLFISLRNKIEHRFSPVIDLAMSGYCQALLLNFEKLLVKEFGDYFSLDSGLLLALQLSNFPEAKKVKKNIQSKYYDQFQEHVNSFCRELPRSIKESQDFCFRAFLVPKIGNHAKTSDLALEFIHYDEKSSEAMEEVLKQVALIREKRVPVADHGKYRLGDVVRMVRERTGLDFKMHLHTKAWKFYKVRESEKRPEGTNPTYCQFSVAFRDFIYTDEWVDFLSEKLADPKEFERVRDYH